MAVADPIGKTGEKGYKHMNNSQIIMNEAVASGYMSSEEVERLLSDGKDIPFHTYAGWKQRGLIPKEGTHGWETKLWRKKPVSPSAPSNGRIGNQGFYLQKSFLFHVSQCEEIKDHEEEEVNSV